MQENHLNIAVVAEKVTEKTLGNRIRFEWTAAS